MALATPSFIPITPLADGKAAYSLILAQTGGILPEGPQSSVLFFPEGVPTTNAANAIAASATDATGRLTSPVTLRPGCLYNVTVPSDGAWTATLFSAGAVVDKVITMAEPI